jgi:hypothetical protein
MIGNLRRAKFIVLSEMQRTATPFTTAKNRFLLTQDDYVAISGLCATGSASVVPAGIIRGALAEPEALEFLGPVRE